MTERGETLIEVRERLRRLYNPHDSWDEPTLDRVIKEIDEMLRAHGDEAR